MFTISRFLLRFNEFPIFTVNTFSTSKLESWDKLLKTAVAPKQNDISVSIENDRVYCKSGCDTPLSLAKNKNLLKESHVLAQINGELKSLTDKIYENCTIDLIDINSKLCRIVNLRTKVFLLNKVIGEFIDSYPTNHFFNKNRLCLEFYIKNKNISKGDFSQLETNFQILLNENLSIECFKVTIDDIKNIFHEDAYRLDQLNNIKVNEIYLCKCGEFIDFSYGILLPRTGLLDKIKLRKLEIFDRGAYNSVKVIADNATQLTHLEIGFDLKLFFQHPLCYGTPIFLPAGVHIHSKLLELVRYMNEKNGISEVITPSIFKSQLWSTSGHADHYQDNIFHLKSREHELKNPDRQFSLKPMNCPGHCLIYQHLAPFNINRLPFRVAELSPVHRREETGAVAGLSRSIRFHQDDAHIFCTPSQVESEIFRILEMIDEVYNILNLRYEMVLSTRPTSHLGNSDIWDNTESVLKNCLSNFRGNKLKVFEGEGAFYGPKIDVLIKNYLGKQLQCGTVQLDFLLPEKFGLTYEDGTDHKTPVLIHRAILGSVERMMAVLLESSQGQLPFWINPKQGIILRCSNEPVVTEYANKVHGQIQSDFKFDIDNSNTTVSFQLQNAFKKKYACYLIVGEKEAANETVTIRNKSSFKQFNVKLNELNNLFSSWTKKRIYDIEQEI